ncbi:MAG: hypothetical protein CMA88_04835 [Euryarchaeota archaeon]|nr:hypothetical protein [Euryarchaeota archaeon]
MDEGGGEVSSGSEPKSMARLSDFPTSNRFSEINERLSILDSLYSEVGYYAYLVRRFWGGEEATMMILCTAGFLLGSWDIGIGELAGGGDYDRWGILGGEESGILHMKDMSLILSLLSVICWAAFIVLLWSSYPIMRENMVYLVIGMAFVQFGYIKAHAEFPNFPEGAGFPGWIWVIVVNLVMFFLSVFVVRKAVVETRDIHVQQRHFHPDPRVIERAWIDHRLRAWSVAIGIWVVFVNISFWSSAHSVAPSPGDLEFNHLLVLLHVISGLVASLLLLAIVWLPEFMLGTAEARIQSSRAREVAGETPVERKVDQGKCPVCNQQTSATMGPTGEIIIPCTDDGCLGKGQPGSQCDTCEARIPSRVICSNCGSNTPVGGHFGRVEVW